MRRFSTPLAFGIALAFFWTVLGAAIVGSANADGRATLGWALLAFVVIATLAQPFRLAGIVAAAGSAVLFAVAGAAQLRLDDKPVQGNLDATALLATAVALLVTPFALRLLLEEIERVQRQLRHQVGVIEELTVRDTVTGAFKSKYLDTILAEEIDRSRRYQRSLTLAVIAGDDWAALVEDIGEVATRGLAAKIVEQLARGTRTADKIIELGDAFAVVMPETPLEGAEVLVARLQATASTAAGMTLRVGLADFPRDAVTSEALLREAEEALAFARTADLLVVDRTLLGQGA